MWNVLYNIAELGLLYASPLAGFAILDILNCIRENKKFWLPSKIIVVIFIWSLGWKVVGLFNS
ncbi:MAG: hypothetical protein Q4P20_05005 [Eubacteriales bacterium]|nr:hypothetical protein [Eubacteriales bacterium]